MDKICRRHEINPESTPIPDYKADALLTPEKKISA